MSWTKADGTGFYPAAKCEFDDGAVVSVTVCDYGYACSLRDPAGNIHPGEDFCATLEEAFDEILWLMSAAGCPHVLDLCKEEAELISVLG